MSRRAWALSLLPGTVYGVLVRRALGHTRRSNPAALLAGATVPFLYPLSYWTLRGMEVGLLATLLLVMMWSLPGPASAHVGADERRSSVMVPRTRVGVAAAAGIVGVFTRLDFVPLALAVVVVTASWSDALSQRVRQVRRLGGCIIGAAVLVLLFQYVYWGMCCRTPID